MSHEIARRRRFGLNVETLDAPHLIAIGLLSVTRGLYRQLLYVAGIPFTFAQFVRYYLAVQPESLGDGARSRWSTRSSRSS